MSDTCQLFDGVDVSDRVGGVRCPIVWIDGADDTIAGERGERPGIIEKLAGVGHLVPIEAPEVVARTAIAMGATAAHS
jgi:pimeloyl-ACP methyl ester carboxylesterase